MSPITWLDEAGDQQPDKHIAETPRTICAWCQRVRPAHDPDRWLEPEQLPAANSAEVRQGICPSCLLAMISCLAGGDGRG